MHPRTRRMTIACLFAACFCVAATAAPKQKTEIKPSQATAVPITGWLSLGPVIDPLPVFHDAERGGFDVKKRLEMQVFPDGAWTPKAGNSAGWFVPGTLWTAREAGADGTVALEPSPGAGKHRPSAIWLAAYVEVDRFRKLKLEVVGKGPRRAWVDGKQVAAGGAGEKADEVVAGEVDCITGKHLVVVESLWPSAEGGWTAGATLRPADDLGSGGVSVSLEPSRGVAILDILDPPRIESVAIAADASFVAAALERFYPGTDKRESWIEVYAKDLYRTYRGGVDVGQVAWAPQGQRLTYVSTERGEGDEAPRSTLWMWDLHSNRVQPLLERVEHFAGYRWSPDGLKIAYLTRVKPDKDKTGIKRLEEIRDRWSHHRTKEYLHLVTVPGGMRRRLTAGPESTGSPEFSPDGKRLLFTRQVEDLTERPFSKTELWEIDLDSFEGRLVRTSRWLRSAHYGPEGRKLLLHASADEFGDAGVNVPEGMIPNYYDGQLFLWDPATGEAEAITRDFDPAVVTAMWNRRTGKVVFTAQDRDYVRLYTYDPATKSFRELDTGFDTFTDLAMAERAPAVAGTGTSPWTPQGLVAIDIDRNLRNTLGRPQKEWFSEVRMGTVESWSFVASSGKTIEGRVYLPPNFDPKRKYPLIVYYYGGTSPTSRSFGGRYPKEYWASQGYVVYTLQPSGATGFGQAFSAVHVNDWGKTTSEEIIEGTKKFLAAHGYVDPKRVGCIGASYGGFMTMLLTTKTDLFAAAVAHAGISSLSSYWGEGYWGYSYSAVATADSYPWNRRDIYVEQSPLFRAHEAKVPLLLTHGVDDTNVPVGESDQFYVALKLLGKEVEYLQVAGQDHWILEHDKRVRWSRSIVAWFDRWLKDQPQWWESLYPTRK